MFALLGETLSWVRSIFYSFKYATFHLTYSFKGLTEIPFAIVIVKDAFATRACT